MNKTLLISLLMVWYEIYGEKDYFEKFLTKYSLFSKINITYKLKSII